MSNFDGARVPALIQNVNLVAAQKTNARCGVLVYLRSRGELGGSGGGLGASKYSRKADGTVSPLPIMLCTTDERDAARWMAALVRASTLTRAHTPQ